MSRFAMLFVALLMLFVVPAPVAAAEPVHSTSTATYSLADAIFDYENFGIYDGDCGDFVLLVDFEVFGASPRGPIARSVTSATRATSTTPPTRRSRSSGTATSR